MYSPGQVKVPPSPPPLRPPDGDISGRHRRRILLSTICRPFPTGLDPGLDTRTHVPTQTHFICMRIVPGRFVYTYLLQGRAHDLANFYYFLSDGWPVCNFSYFSAVPKTHYPADLLTDNQYIRIDGPSCRSN